MLPEKECIGLWWLEVRVALRPEAIDDLEKNRDKERGVDLGSSDSGGGEWGGEREGEEEALLGRREGLKGRKREEMREEEYENVGALEDAGLAELGRKGVEEGVIVFDWEVEAPEEE